MHVGTVEDCLERAALLDADALGLGQPLETASERKLGMELCTPVDFDCHPCVQRKVALQYAMSLRRLTIRHKAKDDGFDIHRSIDRAMRFTAVRAECDVGAGLGVASNLAKNKACVLLLAHHITCGTVSRTYPHAQHYTTGHHSLNISYNNATSLLVGHYWT